MSTFEGSSLNVLIVIMKVEKTKKLLDWAQEQRKFFFLLINNKIFD